MQDSLEAKIIALLFVRTDALALRTVADLVDCSLDELPQAFVVAQELLSPTGLTILVTESECQLVTNDALSEFVASVAKKETTGDLSKAALETLSLIAYLQQATKTELDYVRGVNTALMLRTLLVRGLITKEDISGTARYALSIDALRFLGIANVRDLPQFTETHATLSARLRDMQQTV